LLLYSVLLLLGAKQGLDMYLVGQLKPSSLATRQPSKQAQNRDVADMLLLCHGLVSANAELMVDSD
jgi:hypothetical protein